MYNRYVRDKNGYTRVPTEEHTPTKSISHTPSPPPMQPHPSPPKAHREERPAEIGFLNGVLDRLHLGDMDSGDLLLLALLFFLIKKDADEELITALGLLLIL